MLFAAHLTCRPQPSLDTRGGRFRKLTGLTRRFDQSQNQAQLKSSAQECVTALRSLTVREPLAACASHRLLGPHRIVKPHYPALAALFAPFTVRIAEIEFREVAVKVDFAHVEIGAVNSALQNREIIFRAIGVGQQLAYFAHVLVGHVVHDVMHKILAQMPVLASIVRHHHRAVIHVRFHNRAQVVACDIRNMGGTDHAAALDEREHDLLPLAADVFQVPLVLMFVLLFAADIGFIGLNSFAFATERANVFLRRSHRFTDAVGHEPSAFVRDAEHPVQLMGGNSLLAGCHQMKAENPFVQRNMAAFHDRPNRHRERLPARVALIHAGAMRLALNQRRLIGPAKPA
jgi:hypothetical protein